jgi:maleylpyruvate isomerase
MASVSHPTPTIELVRTASQRLVRTIDSLDDDAWAQPSLLPGWDVAHVAAHLALNAEGLAGALAGIVEGEPVTMYASRDARDADIDKLAKAEPAHIRDRVLASVTRFDGAVRALPAERAGTEIERTPGSGMTCPAGAVASMRLREVEIHHADIGAALAGGYSPADWPTEFTGLLLEHEAKRYDGPGFRADASDLGRSWLFGTPGPTVTGLGHEIAWWGTGRTPYPGTTGPVSDDGVLPGIEAM